MSEKKVSAVLVLAIILDDIELVGTLNVRTYRVYIFTCQEMRDLASHRRLLGHIEDSHVWVCSEIRPIQAGSKSVLCNWANVIGQSKYQSLQWTMLSCRRQRALLHWPSQCSYISG